ncbi:hypothetical protein D3C84_949960 [compost metagenome]
MTAGFKQVGPLPQNLFTLIAGDFHERAVHMDNQPVAISDQHPFAGAIEHGGSLTQTLTIFAAFTQSGADSQASKQSNAGNKDQPGAQRHPHVTVDQLPAHPLD